METLLSCMLKQKVLCSKQSYTIVLLILDASQVHLSQEPSVTRDPALFAEARVDARDFQKFLQSYLVNPTQVVCCMFVSDIIIVKWYFRAGFRDFDVMCELGILDKTVWSQTLFALTCTFTSYEILH